MAKLRQAANSADFRERAIAGEHLVMYADDASAAQLLLRLLLDAENTFVTEKTSQALIARGDLAALRVYAQGYLNAESDSIEFFENPGRLSRAQRKMLIQLTMDDEAEVAAGAREIVAWLDAGYGGPQPD